MVRFADHNASGSNPRSISAIFDRNKHKTQKQKTAICLQLVRFRSADGVHNWYSGVLVEVNVYTARACTRWDGRYGCLVGRARSVLPPSSLPQKKIAIFSVLHTPVCSAPSPRQNKDGSQNTTPPPPCVAAAASAKRGNRKGKPVPPTKKKKKPPHPHLQGATLGCAILRAPIACAFSPPV